MTKAVIFDMFETLITHYRSPLYFGAQMAEDAGIPKEQFLTMWRATEKDRTMGRLTLEDVLTSILQAHGRYSPELLHCMTQRRTAVVESCFDHLHPEIFPLLTALKERGIAVALISNCFSEEAQVIRRCILLPFFDGVYLSYEQGAAKPDLEIYRRCMADLGVTAAECVYVGDGGSRELEAAQMLGMKAVQAVWYLREGITPSQPRSDFPQAKSPVDVLTFLNH